MEAKGIPGIRNDSGDLAYITIEERLELDRHNLNDVLIFQTNDLDEYSIESIKEQIFTYAPKAGLDPNYMLKKIVWACRTNPGTCSDQPSIGGVAKLTSIEKDNYEKAVIKIAYDNPIKTSIPGNNRSSLILSEGELVCCLIHHKDEIADRCDIAYHPDDVSKTIILQHLSDLECKSRQQLVYEFDKPWTSVETFQSIRERTSKEIDQLHWTYKRLQNPHLVKVSLSERVFRLRENLVSNFKLIED